MGKFAREISRLFNSASCIACIVLVSAVLPGGSATAEPKYSPGASDAEIVLGQTGPYSGPASLLAGVGKTFSAYFQMINDQGGINGRKIKFISMDDAYSASKTVEHTRKLVESDQVLAIVGTTGTVTNAAIQRYLNGRKIPQLFMVSGASKLVDPKQFPWSMTGMPTYKTEAEVYARYVLESVKDPKVGVLSQNDDFGRDYVRGFRAALGERADSIIVKEVTYDPTDPTIDSQIVTLKASGATVLLDVALPRFAGQAIRAVSKLGWNPIHIVNLGSTSVRDTLQVAGLEESSGLISTTYYKDPTDAAWKDDEQVKEFHSFLARYYPAGVNDNSVIAPVYMLAAAMVQVLRQCKDDLTNENVMAQAANLKQFAAPLLLPGITMNTSEGDYFPIEQLQMMRFNGKNWERFGAVLGR